MTEMKQFDSTDWDLRSSDNAVVSATVVDILLGEIEVDDAGRFRRVIISMPRTANIRIGTGLRLWNATVERMIPFTVMLSHYDLVMKASKIEGRWSA